MNRDVLPNRRPGFIRRMIFGGGVWNVHFSFAWPRLRVTEIFISSEKPDSEAAACARDGAIYISHALQRGASIEELASSATRDPNGKAATVVGAALDLVAAEAEKLATELGLQQGVQHS